MVKIEGGLNTSSGRVRGLATTMRKTTKPKKRKGVKKKKGTRRKRQESVKTLYLWPPLSDFLEHQYSLPVTFSQLLELTWTKINESL